MKLVFFHYVTGSKQLGVGGGGGGEPLVVTSKIVRQMHFVCTDLWVFQWKDVIEK